MLRVGIIGTGIHGTRYARHVTRDVDDMRLAAISRRSDSGSAQAADWGCAGGMATGGIWSPTGQSMRSLQRRRPISISTSPGHALRPAGRSCSKKPLAVDFTQAKRIVDLFADARIPLTVGQTLRYNPVILNLKRYLPRVGELYFFAATHRLEPSVHAWLTDPAVAGGGRDSAHGPCIFSMP